MATFYIWRHWETGLNADGDKIRWWLNGPEAQLTPKGIQEAKDSAEDVPSDLVGFVVSNLGRAEDTAKIWSKESGKPILEYTEGMRPWNMGILQGKEAANILDKMKYYVEHPNEIIPKGSKYYSAHGLWEDKWETYRRCFSCYELAEEVHILECEDNLYEDEYTAFGNLLESAREYGLID